MYAADTSTPFCLEGMDLAGVQDRSSEANVIVRLNSDTTILRLIPYLNKRQAAEAALTRFGFERLPAPGRFSEAGQYRLAWAGRNCWHLMCSPADATEEQELKEVLGGLAAVTNASDGLFRMEIAGKDAASLMAKGCVLDLDHFLPGHCAVTLMAHTRLHIHRMSGKVYELMMPASHAASFWEWLCMSAAEFGMDVELAANDEPASAA
ncbi:sarcosine oxidase subunit gamma family protein [Nitratireductor sp. XY-223]|uniref:sarcosine oxidase subunit gamma n=1 Tax=Nitratireductor sp. XY-223 TaxID=2561926 RepID=UPI0010AA2897|nr:sarcosine oxidase subunit gamma family protein [Nitratireductor sp. XY-223]